MGYIQRFGLLSVLDGISYEYFNMHIKPVFKRTLRRKQTRSIITKGVMERKHKNLLTFENIMDDGKGARSHKILKSIG